MLGPMRRAAPLLAWLTLAGCANPAQPQRPAAPPVATAAPPAPRPPTVLPGPPPLPPETPPASLGLDLAALPDCRTILVGECRVTGTYSLATYMGMRSVLDVWPALILADGDTLMLDSIWFRDRRPAQATLDRFEGKLVEVVGELHMQPPKEPGRNMIAPCLSPIHSLRVVGDAP